MVTFTQQMGGFDLNQTDQEFMKVCTEHPECKDCPLLTKNINVNGVAVTCITGRRKGANNNG